MNINFRKGNKVDNAKMMALLKLNTSIFFSKTIQDHSFSTYAKFSEKHISFPLISVRVRTGG